MSGYGYLYLYSGTFQPFVYRRYRRIKRLLLFRRKIDCFFFRRRLRRRGVEQTLKFLIERSRRGVSVTTVPAPIVIALRESAAFFSVKKGFTIKSRAVTVSNTSDKNGIV